MALVYRVATIGVIVVAIAACAYVLWPLSVPDRILAEYASWEPTAATIARKVGTAPSGDYRDARHQEFARLFQQRFRQNGVAVHVRFLADDWVELRCAAVLEPWRMARIAVQLCEEVSTVLGRHVTVEIRETFLATADRKVGEAHPGGDGGRVDVVFDPLFAADDSRSVRSTDLLKPLDSAAPQNRQGGAHEAPRPPVR